MPPMIETCKLCKYSRQTLGGIKCTLKPTECLSTKGKFLFFKPKD